MNPKCDEKCFECKYKDCVLPSKYFRKTRQDTHDKIILTCETGKIVFANKAEALRFLGRSKSYLNSAKVQKTMEVLSTDGRKYKLQIGGNEKC